jgi:hypothetical protein
MMLFHAQVLHVLLEHVAQLVEDDLMRLAPPPIPNDETSF